MPPCFMPPQDRITLALLYDLLFDQNIPFRELQTIEAHFPESTQVRLEGFEIFGQRNLGICQRQ